jgi:GNAT superfamily N-acetyltransferase
MDISYSFDLAKLDFATIHSWLTGTYWSPGISRERVEKGFRSSTVVIGCYAADGTQIGVARCLSDTTRFAYFSDVFVSETWRGHGIAREMVRRLLQHPDVGGAERHFLMTEDAHNVYRPLGFENYPHPDRLMYRSKTL